MKEGDENMSKQNKTVGKTTNPKKGEATMTIADALTQLMLSYNDYQEYRKDKDQSYNFVSKQQMSEFARTLDQEELKTLTKTYIYQRQMQTKLSKYLYKEKVLYNAYGKERPNIMELTDEERAIIKKKRDRKNEIAEQRKEVK